MAAKRKHPLPSAEAVRQLFKYDAETGLDGRTKYLGSYETADRAHAEYVAAKRQFHEGCTL